MTGVSYMLPLVVAGGLAIALAFAIGGIQEGAYPEGTIAAALMKIGGDTAFRLFIAVFSGFIAYSIADRPGIAPGMVGGFLAQTLGRRLYRRNFLRFPRWLFHKISGR